MKPLGMIMKKLGVLILTMFLALTIAGCGKKSDFDISIVVPAGSQEEFVYSEEEISPQTNKLTIYPGDGLGDALVTLKSNDANENAFEATYITNGASVTFDVTKGNWYQIGVSVQNTTEEEIKVFVKAEAVEVRIE